MSFHSIITNSRTEIILGNKKYSSNELLLNGRKLLKKFDLYNNCPVALQATNNELSISVLLALIEKNCSIFMVPLEREIDDYYQTIGCDLLKYEIDAREDNIKIKGNNNYQKSKFCKVNLYGEGSLIMLTSGSTGNPKVIQHSFSNLFLAAKNVIDAYKINEYDFAIGVLPITHINGLVTTLLAPIASNSNIIFQSKPFNLLELKNNISNFKCTWFSATPFHLKQILDRKEDFFQIKSNLRFIRSASAHLTEGQRIEIEKIFNIPVFNSMGMTEAAGQICTNDFRKIYPDTVGIPINVNVAVLRNKKIYKNGRGELLYKGNTVVKSYLFNDNKNLFFDGWLRSGDEGLIKRNGSVCLYGRIQNTINFCGLKFLAEELEKKIEKKIDYKLLVSIENSDLFNNQIIIYTNQKTLKLRNLFYSVRKILYSPQILKEVRLINDFPILSTNKIDRNSLKKSKIINYYSPKKIILNSSNLSESLDRAICDTLGISISEINKDLSSLNDPRWDSLATISLSVIVEDYLERRLSSEEIVYCSSYEKIYNLLLTKNSKNKNSNITINHKEDKIEKNLINDLVKKYKLDSTKFLYLIANWNFLQNYGFNTPKSFIFSLINSLDKTSILLMNSFTFQFCEGIPYCSKLTKSETGLIPESFRMLKNTWRTKSSIYPYIFSRKVDEFQHESDSCWGVNSTCYKILNSNDCSVINLGTQKSAKSLLSGNTCVHALEEMFQVKYRMYKKFTGLARFDENYIPHKEFMFVRKKEFSSTDYHWSDILDRIKSYDTTISDWNYILRYSSSSLLKEGCYLFNKDPYFPLVK